MVEYKGQTCKSCGEPIHWTVTAATGKAMPVDRDAVLGGNLVLTQSGYRTTATVVTPDPAIRRHVSHFVTCPNKAEHRKKPARKRARKADSQAVIEAADRIIEGRRELLEDLGRE